MTGDASKIEALTARLSRGERPRLVARLTRIFGAAHLSLAEDAVQEAFVSALELWAARGVPDEPAAWLLTVARNRALDRLRRGALFAALEPKVTDWVETLQERAPAGEGPLGDDELSMIALCCHPQLPEEARLALTLKVACGFGVDEIARAFLSPSPKRSRSASCARRRGSAISIFRSTCRPGTRCRSGCRRCCARSICCSTKGMRRAAARF